MSKYKEISLDKIKTYSVKDRASKVYIKNFMKIDKEVSTKDFIEGLPDILKAKEFKEFLSHCEDAIENKKPIIVMMGGHVIKCGLSPIFIKAIEKGIINTIAVNGSVCIHDFEIAFFGKTSEDVDSSLEDGSFGMGKETGRIINQVINKGYESGLGYGEALGKYIFEEKPKYWEYSILAKAYQHNIPVTVHVAIGTDITHQHKYANGESIGGASFRDFKIFCNQVKGLNDSGVLINFGSAVILPEVFLKAVTIVRNLGFSLKNFYTAVFDMNLHYRPMTNVVQRPTASGGKGYYFVGHHEIMIPLFWWSLFYRVLPQGHKDIKKK
ncbi:MAG: hypothetical protein J7J77_02825 [Candidatus Cloacimonetes bacterium]|nr:hypothetical protein [Candidatus Cloacimonadota bacterium]